MSALPPVPSASQSSLGETDLFNGILDTCENGRQTGNAQFADKNVAGSIATYEAAIRNTEDRCGGMSFMTSASLADGMADCVALCSSPWSTTTATIQPPSSPQLRSDSTDSIASSLIDGLRGASPAMLQRATPALKKWCVLHSNLANAALQSSQWRLAAVNAAAAVRIATTVADTDALRKAALRLAAALLAEDKHLAASVVLTAHVGDCADDEVADLRQKAFRAIRLQVDDFRRVPWKLQRLHSHDSRDTSVGCVATRQLHTGDVIFVESEMKFNATNLSLDGVSPDLLLTSEQLIRHFTRALCSMAAKQSSAQNDSSSSSSSVVTLTHVMKALNGAWPRHASDLSGPLSCKLRAVVDEVIDTDFPDLVPSTERNTGGPSSQCSGGPITSLPALRDEIFDLAVKCRYNYFFAGVFRTCALINHGCRPNAAMKCRPQQPPSSSSSSGGANASGYNVSLEICRDVSPGDTLSVKYLSDFDFLNGLTCRRERMFGAWQFVCRCERCSAEAQPSCKTEWVRCWACEADTPRNAPISTTRLGFVHAPLPSGNVEYVVAVAAEGASASPASCCNACGRSFCGWRSDDETTFATLALTVKQLLLAQQRAASAVPNATSPLTVIASSAQVAVERVYLAVNSLRRSLHPLVHTDNSAFNGPLYAFCVTVQPHIRIAWLHLKSLTTATGEEGRASAVHLLVRSLCLGDPATAAVVDKKVVSIAASPCHRADADGRFPFSSEVADDQSRCNTIALLMELWQRMSDYYPPAQAWSLHRMIVHALCLRYAVVISVPLPPSPAQGDDQWSFIEPALREHGAFLGVDDIDEVESVMKGLLPSRDAHRRICHCFGKARK